MGQLIVEGAKTLFRRDLSTYMSVLTAVAALILFPHIVSYFMVGTPLKVEILNKINSSHTCNNISGIRKKTQCLSGGLIM